MFLKMGKKHTFDNFLQKPSHSVEAVRLLIQNLSLAMKAMMTSATPQMMTTEKYPLNEEKFTTKEK